MIESQAAHAFKNWAMNLDQRLIAVLVGLSIGAIAGLIGLMLALLGPLLTLAALGGFFAGLYVLTDLRIALYGTMVTMIMLPFGTFPVRIGITPTLLDLAMGAFVLVYILQWITGRKRDFQLSPAHILLSLYVMWLIFAFMMGLRFGSPTPNVLRQFAEALLSISMAYILVDVLRDAQALRRLVLLVMALVGLQAGLAIALYALPDVTAERLLVRLSRIGYPDGGVIRYIESNPALGERAIGTWVDPNTLGGLLAVGAVMIAPQVFAKRPVLRYRWLTLAVLGLVSLALLLSSSRASFLAFGGGLFVIALLRYRRLLPLLFGGGFLLLFLPQTQNYINRLLQAFQGADLATQMRIGEWRDSLTLISRYPVFGIGFTGTPTNDVYTDVANMYLIMANQIGLVGVALFLTAMAGILFYGYRAWRYARHDAELDSIHLGYQVALLTALINAFADLYFFRLDFQSSIAWFWLVVALAIASSRLVLERYQSTIVTDDPIK